jgi:hypothetical protein
MAILIIVRSEKAKEEMLRSGVKAEHVLDSGHPDFLRDLEQKNRRHGSLVRLLCMMA